MTTSHPLVELVYSTLDFTLTPHSSILYSLGIGFTSTPEHLPFTYEKHQNFSVFPSMSAAIGMRDIEGLFRSLDGYDSRKILHGEEDRLKNN